MIDGRTKLLGLIGSPVAHSLSPLIHNFLSDSLGLNYRYIAFDTDGKDAADVIKAARTLNIAGLSVTSPLKKAVVPFLDEADEDVRRSTSCNNITNMDGRLIGHNTDIFGIISSFIHSGADPSGKKVLVIGAGGAAAAAVCALSELRAREVIIVNRTYDKAKALVENASAESRTTALSCCRIEEAKDIRGLYAIAQCSSAGMNTPDETPVPDTKVFDGVSFALDLVYQPRETRFLREAAEQGVKTVGGITHVLWQAIAAYKLWTGIDHIDGGIIARLGEYLEERD